MAFLYQNKKFELATLTKVEFRYPGLVICELGNQIVRERGIDRYSAKFYYGNKGAIHMSIDMNGRDGAYQYDLRKPIPSVFHSRFDLVTDYGTIEHVNNQYEAWRNVHKLCRVGGVMIHVVPLEGYYKGHSNYYYNEDIMENIAAAFGYEVLQIKIITRTKKMRAVAAAFRKGQSFFPDEQRFSEIGIIEVGGGKIYKFEREEND